jgi:hypothetical protein
VGPEAALGSANVHRTAYNDPAITEHGSRGIQV